MLISKLKIGFIANKRGGGAGKMNKNCKKLQEIGKNDQVLNRNVPEIGS